MFPHLMRHLRIHRAGRGRARTRSDRVRGDKAYSSRAIRGHPRGRGITAASLNPPIRPGIANAAVPSAGVHPPSTWWTTAVERHFTLLEQWRGPATRYDCEDDRVPSGARV
ncbi:hypothetical protein [Amycolatopsis sp. NPDC049159]|uniref:hypothetical protein n=1 Tax=Amycolatopsis sp. NPDC049159 TaxID=3157210 RepID=UPI0033EB6392